MMRVKNIIFPREDPKLVIQCQMFNLEILHVQVTLFGPSRVALKYLEKYMYICINAYICNWRDNRGH